MAYGTSLKKGAVVTTSRDTSRVARALEALRSSAGSTSPASTSRTSSSPPCRSPASRCATAARRAASPCGSRRATPTRVEIRFFDTEGRDIDPGAQRKIERLLYREDFRRAFGGDIGDIVFPPRSLEFYTAALERIVDIEQAARASAFKIVLDYSFGAASIVMPSLLAKLGADVLAVNPFASTSSATRDAPRSATRRWRASPTSCACPAATSAS